MVEREKEKLQMLMKTKAQLTLIILSIVFCKRFLRCVII